VLLAWAAGASATAAAGKTPYNFNEFFQGDWDVQRAETSFASSNVVYGARVVVVQCLPVWHMNR